MNLNMDGKKLNVHAARDGTAAVRHGGAPCEHSNFSEKLYLVLLVGYTVVYSSVRYCTLL